MKVFTANGLALAVLVLLSGALSTDLGDCNFSAEMKAHVAKAGPLLEASPCFSAKGVGNECWKPFEDTAKSASYCDTSAGARRSVKENVNHVKRLDAACDRIHRSACFGDVSLLQEGREAVLTGGGIEGTGPANPCEDACNAFAVDSRSLGGDVAQRGRSAWAEASSLQTTLAIYAGSGFYYDPDLFLRAGQHTLAFLVDQVFYRMDVSYDGGGWTKVSDRGGNLNPVIVTPPWTTTGVHRLKMRWLNEAGKFQEHAYRVVVVPAADRMFSDSDENSMVLWKGGGSDLDKPLLVVEGFDPKDTQNPAAESQPERYYAGAIDFFGEAGWHGADVVILNFSDGGRSILDNAQVVQDAVRYVTAIKTGSTPVRLAGISMGGIAARYALAKAEEDGDALRCNPFCILGFSAAGRGDGC